MVISKSEFATSKEAFDNLYTEFIKNNYLFVYTIVRNKEATLTIMQQVFEAVFIVDPYKLIQTSIRQEIYSKAILYSKDYVSNHPNVEQSYDISIDYPMEELKLFKFNLAKFQNERTNMIIILRLVYNLKFKDIARYVNLPCEAVIDEYVSIMNRIKIDYKEKKKNYVK